LVALLALLVVIFTDIAIFLPHFLVVIGRA
jgi:hypothetical protein